MINLFLANLKMAIRNRQALFWTLVFPLIFTVIFGFFFGGNSLTGGGKIGLVNNAKSTIAESFATALNGSKVFTVVSEPDEATVRDLIRKGTLAGAIEIPAGFGDRVQGSPTQIIIISDPGNATTTAAMSGFVTQFETTLNFQIIGQKPTYTIATKTTLANTLTYFDFVLIGIFGFSLMTSSVNGISTAMTKYREQQILKRIMTTPLPTWKFISAEVSSRLVVNMAQIVVIYLVGRYGFNGHIYGNLALLFAFALLGGLLFQGLGFLIAAFAKTTDAADSMATAVTIPMMFLAGVFFPIDNLPKWLGDIVQFLPLAPLLQMMRTIGLDDASPFIDPKNIIIVVGWIIVLLALTIWRFRLVEE